MSVMEMSIQGVEARILWSCSKQCLELIALGTRDVDGLSKPLRYEVHICGQTKLYESRSEFSARQYLQMLLGDVNF